jgi:hypothetical protein
VVMEVGDGLQKQRLFQPMRCHAPRKRWGSIRMPGRPSREVVRTRV